MSCVFSSTNASLQMLPLLCVQTIAGFLTDERDLRALRCTARQLVHATPEPGTRCLNVYCKADSRVFRRLQRLKFLQYLHYLDISWCTDITDVRELAGIHTLIMKGCIGVKDVSALAGIHTLNMIGCSDVTGVECLTGISSFTDSMHYYVQNPMLVSPHSHLGMYLQKNESASWFST